MTQYFTDFSAYTAGAQPSDMTRRWVNTGGSWLVTTNAGFGGVKKGLVFNPTVDARYGLSWDVIDSDPDRATVELVFRWKSSAGANADARAFARASGAAAAETGMHAGVVNGTRRISKIVAGTQTNIVTPAWKTLADDTWYWTRVRFEGTTHSVRSWDDGVAEPGTWSTTTTDASISAAGWVGLYLGVQAGDTTWDCLGVGTNGDVAPIAPVAGGAHVNAIVANTSAAAPAPVVTSRVTVIGGAPANTTATALAPVIKSSGRFAVPAANADADFIEPVIRSGFGIQAIAAAATAAMLTPGYAAGSRVGSLAAVATAAALAPTTKQGVRILAVVTNVAATAISPSVHGVTGPPPFLYQDMEGTTLTLLGVWNGTAIVPGHLENQS